MTRTTFIGLNPDKYNEGLCYYPVMINLDICNRNSNTFDDPSSRICVSNKTADVNSSVFNVITRINKSKKLTNVNVNLIVENIIQIKSGITIIVDASAKIREKIRLLKKIIFGILVHVLVKMVNIYKLL